jgi:hypothetical protein
MASDGLRLSPKEARRLIFDALTGAGTLPANAGYFADAILDTELSGLEGHGFYWLQYYCEHVSSGKVDGRALPKVTKLSPVAFRVDARRGFAHPAIEKGFSKLIPAARKNGIAGMAVHNSYNAATLGFHTGTLARNGLVAFGFTNAMPVIAPVGGNKPVIGTNPLSFAVPGKPGKIAEVRTGRLVLDGDIIVPSDGDAVTTRRRLARDGLLVVVLDAKGGSKVEGIGLPLDEDYAAFVDEAEADVVKALSKLRGKDRETVAEAARLAARRAAQRWCGKKPQTRVIFAGG